MLWLKRCAIVVAVIASLSIASCAAKAATVSLVGTWKSNRLVYMFDADGTCIQVDLQRGSAYQNGTYSAKGDRLDIEFDSGLGLKYSFRPAKSGNLQVTDLVTNNSFEFVKEP